MYTIISLDSFADDWLDQQNNCGQVHHHSHKSNTDQRTRYFCRHLLLSLLLIFHFKPPPLAFPPVKDLFFNQSCNDLQFFARTKMLEKCVALKTFPFGVPCAGQTHPFQQNIGQEAILVHSFLPPKPAAFSLTF